MSIRSVIFVLGTWRSGTSALTRVLSLCGCRLPQSLLGATDLNPTGFWEPVDATKLNIEFLSRLGILGDPGIRIREIEIDNSDKQNYIGQVQAFLSSCPQGPLLVIKDSRINELMEFWLEAAYREGFSAKAVIAVRHPQEVFASFIDSALFYRGPEMPSANEKATSLETISALWLKENLLAEHHSRDLPRVVVHYSNLLKNRRREVDRISRALSINVDVDENAIDRFLTEDLHRQRYTGPITESFGYSWTTRVYSILSAAAEDEPMDLAGLDEIRNAYGACARAFRIALSETKKTNSQQLRDYVNRQPIWKAGRDY